MLTAPEIRKWTITSILAAFCGVLGFWVWFYCFLCYSIVTDRGGSWPPILGEMCDLAWTVIVMLFLIFCCGRSIARRFQNSHHPAKAQGSRRSRWLKIAAGVLAAFTMAANAPILLAVTIWLVSIKPGAGRFDQPRMEHIVAQVRSRHFGRSQGFIVDSAGNIVDREHPSISGDLLVFADHSDDGVLTIQIVTNEQGHAGSWGFVYMDPPVAMEKEEGADDGRLSTPCGGPLDATYPQDRIDEHWMRAWDDED